MRSAVSTQQLVAGLRGAASQLGFHLFGVAPAVTPEGYHRLVQWVQSGYAGHMTYLGDRLAAYRHPSGVLEGTRSLVVLGFPYRTAAPPEPAALEGRISRYAWGGADYHDLLHSRLKQLRQQILAEHPHAQVRGVVDSAPLMEREFAVLAGLGWTGKNTLLINKYEGSYFFLACLLTDLDLPADQPFNSDHCGTCRRCLDACPTDAFVQPGVLDSRRCISYLTIEHRGPIPLPLREGIGDWLFGCDVCQDVCPWNRRGSEASVPELWPVEANHPIDLIALLEMDDEAFRQRFRRTPLWRSRRRGVLRNAAICLGNARDPAAVPALASALSDCEPLIRGAAAWALGVIGGPTALAALQQHRPDEPDPQVIDEIDQAIGWLCAAVTPPIHPFGQ